METARPRPADESTGAETETGRPEPEHRGRVANWRRRWRFGSAGRC